MSCLEVMVLVALARRQEISNILSKTSLSSLTAQFM